MSIRIISRSVWNNPGNRDKRVRKLFAALRWQIYKRVVKRPKLITLANGARFRAYPDCVISSALQYADVSILTLPPERSFQAAALLKSPRPAA